MQELANRYRAARRAQEASRTDFAAPLHRQVNGLAIDQLVASPH